MAEYFLTEEDRKKIAALVREQEQPIAIDNRPPPGRRDIARMPLWCKVEIDGGGPGSATGPCTFTYTVKQIHDGAVLGTALTPKKPRPAIGKMLTPTEETNYGQCFYDEQNVFQLWDAGEVLDLRPCPTTPPPPPQASLNGSIRMGVANA
jgi:hypothetical protein